MPQSTWNWNVATTDEKGRGDDERRLEEHGRRWRLEENGRRRAQREEEEEEEGGKGVPTSGKSRRSEAELEGRARAD
ncbi:hypothetical protein Droror1_Dr00007720 [Drosera rotundifolia]